MKIKNKKDPIKFRLSRGLFGHINLFITVTEFLDPLDPYSLITHEIERPATKREIDEIISRINSKSTKL